MPMLHVYVTDDTLRTLREIATERGRGEKAEHLAESAIENAAMEVERMKPRDGGIVVLRSTNQPWRPGQ